MKLLSAVCSDRGIKKKINQDSLLVRSAMTKEGEILLAAVCDGMGGLEKGEVASGEVIRALERWFEETLPLLLSGEQEKKGVGERRKRAIAKSLESLIQEENQMISVYGKEKNLLLGTTGEMYCCSALECRRKLLRNGSREYIIREWDF